MKTIKKIVRFILEGIVFVLFLLKFMFISSLYWALILLIKIIGGIIWRIEDTVKFVKNGGKQKEGSD